MYPYNHKMGQRIQTNANGVAVDRGFIAHISISAEDAVTKSDNGILSLSNLEAEAQEITEGLNNPAVPRNIRIKGNVADINKAVKITGLNYGGTEITEEVTAAGTTAKEGVAAFKAITKIELPEQIHTPVAQVETATAAGKVTTAGNALVTVTSKLYGEAIAVDVPVELNDEANEIAAAIRATLEANETITEHFDVSGKNAAVVLTAKVPAANDDTLNIAIANGTGDGASVGVTAAATSTTTTAGVPYDQISVGWGDMLGLPFLLAHNTVFATYHDNKAESTAPEVTTDAAKLEGNTVKLNTALNGKDVDIYLIV